MTAASPAVQLEQPTRVLLADDSAIVRGLLSRWIAADPRLAVVGLALNGKDAITQAGKLNPDVIVLDVEMPELDGLSAIPQILAAAPRAKILMASTLTRRSAEVTLKALAAGASDYLAKPEAGLGAAESFKLELIQKIVALGQKRAAARPAVTRATPPPPVRRAGVRPPAEVLVVGSSTGGPLALQTVLPALVGKLDIPILVVQHMPAMFTAILAEHLAKRLNGACAEVVDGQELKPGFVHIAPGDRHMRLERKGTVAKLKLDKSPPVNFCRPAVDPLFESAARAYGAATLGVVLTGMGVDGRAGAEAIVTQGGAVIVQDEPTSVVWGMPGAIAQAGLAAAIKPLDELGPAILAMSQGNVR